MHVLLCIVGPYERVYSTTTQPYRRVNISVNACLASCYVPFDTCDFSFLGEGTFGIMHVLSLPSKQATTQSSEGHESSPCHPSTFINRNCYH